MGALSLNMKISAGKSAESYSREARQGATSHRGQTRGLHVLDASPQYTQV
jgi:hypothetical protein